MGSALPPSEPAAARENRAALEDLPMLVWSDAAGSDAYYMNAAHREFAGTAGTHFSAADRLALIHPSDRHRYTTAYDTCRGDASPVEVDFRMLRYDGQYRWIVERGAPVFDETGALAGYTGYAVDTTEHREADRVRHEMEEQVRVLGLATRDWVWSWDVVTDRVIHNGALSEAIGDAPGPREASFAWWRALVHPGDVSRATQVFQNAASTEALDVVTEFRIRLKTASYAHVEARACFVRDAAGNVVRVLAAMRNITQRKRIEEAHARFTTILESTSDFVCMCSVGGLLLYINAAGRKLLGWTEEHATSTMHISTLHPAWAAEILFEEGIPTAVRAGTWAGETALLTSDGKELPVSQVVIAHRDAEGELEFLSTIIRDISERKREDVARIEWANRYDAAIRASGQVLFDWNSTTSDIKYAGDMMALLGYTTDEMAGGLERFRKAVHPDDLPSFDAEISRVTATRDPFRHSFRAIHRDGRVVEMDAKGYFFIDRQGQFGRMVGFLADVSVQRMAERELASAHGNLEARVAKRTEELQRATAVIRERALQTEIVAQLGHRALSGTPLKELLVEAPQLVRQTLRVDFVTILELTSDGRELVSIAESGWPMQGANRVGVGQDSQSGYTLLTGEPVIVEDAAVEKRFTVSEAASMVNAVSSVSVVIESANRPLGVLIAFTRYKRSFAQDDVNFLQSMANVLTAAIDRNRAEQSIRTAHEQAEAANRAKSDFLSRMSHELRTPLNAIIGFTQLLELESSTPSQSESINHISKAGAHLLTLINEVLDIARIESGRMTLTPEPMNLPMFLRESVDAVRAIAEKAQVSIELRPTCDAECTVLGEEPRLKQVMLNLLSNAVKYNRPGGRVIVDCMARGSRQVVRVTDTGKGISPEKLERLFVPFERLGAESTEIDGTGLGLALSKRIMHSLNGELGGESTLGEGSTFWFEIPRVEPVAHLDDPPPPPPPSADAGVTCIVLYVEDQELNLRLVERILNQRPGYKLVKAMRGLDAFDIARECMPDIVLLDLNLPDISGEEVLKRFKADPDLCHIPVVMVSAEAIGSRIDELMLLGADGYLTKPYKLQEFLSVIDTTLADIHG